MHPLGTPPVSEYLKNPQPVPHSLGVTPLRRLRDAAKWVSSYNKNDGVILSSAKTEARYPKQRQRIHRENKETEVHDERYDRNSSEFDHKII